MCEVRAVQYESEALEELQRNGQHEKHASNNDGDTRLETICNSYLDR